MQLTSKQINSKIGKIKFDDFDLIVAIARNGIPVARILSKKLNLPIKVLWLRFRDKDQNKIYKKPKLLRKFSKIKDKKVLLVDDVSKSSSTLKKAKEILEGNKIKTFVVNGKADYNLFDYRFCLKMPWKTNRNY